MPAAIKITNLPEVNAKVHDWFKAVERAATEAAVGLAKAAFEQIITEGPQYSGDFVANTKVSVGSPDGSFKENALGWRKDHNLGPGLSNALAFQRGDEPAINYALSHAKWPKLVLGQKIFISSSAQHDQPYSVLIEEGQITLRPVNAGASHIYRRAQAFVLTRYSRITKTNLEALRK